MDGLRVDGMVDWKEVEPEGAGARRSMSLGKGKSVDCRGSVN